MPNPARFTSGHPEEAAALIAAQGIVEKAPIAQKALPYCNIVCLTGQEMKDALSGYLSILMEQDAKSIGGQMPGMTFIICHRVCLKAGFRRLCVPLCGRFCPDGGSHGGLR